MTMRAMRLHELGGALVADRAPIPTPGPGEARLRVRACGVNFADTLLVTGAYQEKPDPPFAPGLEVCGVVEAIGPAAPSLASQAAPQDPSQNKLLGRRVMAKILHGGFADHAIAPIGACAAVPDAISDVEAAAAPIAYGTAHLGLDRRANLRPGERLLVLGAAGGVGLTAVEIGKLMGAEVVACARGPRKLAAAKAKGADHLIDAEDGPDALRLRVKELGGADVVFDPVGGELWKAALRAANPEARLLPIGFASGDVPQIPANILLVKNLTVIGFYWGAYLEIAPAALGDSLQTIVGWMESGQLRPHVSDVLPLSQANAALDLLRGRKAIGKVVLHIAEA